MWTRINVFLWVSVMVLNTTFNNISAISWRSVLLVEETWVLSENHQHATSHWQTCANKTDCHQKARVSSLVRIYAPPLPYFKVPLPFSPSPLRLNIFFAYLWSFRWPNYIVTLPRYFSFRLPHLNIPPQTNWTRIFSERRLVYFSVIETDTVTSGLRWIFHMHSEFSKPAM